MTTIKTYELGPNAEAVFDDGYELAGFNPDAPEIEYETDRARALYAALGADEADEEFQIGALPDGRWALVGLAVDGHRFAVET